MGIAGKIVRALPERVQQSLRKNYYPGVLRKFTAEQWEYSPAIQALIPDAGTVIDAGANVGYLSHLFAGWVGARGQVYSFEPVPWTFEILASNMKKLGVTNASVFPLALSDAAGSARMQIPRYDDGRENLYESRITAEVQQDLRSVEVQLVSLDDYLVEQVSKVDFIKIDVEGHELQVVRGARRILERDHPPLLIEVSGNLADDDSSSGQLRQELAEKGYRAQVIVAGTAQPWDGAEELGVLLVERVPEVPGADGFAPWLVRPG